MPQFHQGMPTTHQVRRYVLWSVVKMLVFLANVNFKSCLTDAAFLAEVNFKSHVWLFPC